MSIERQGNGQRFVFRVKGVMFSASWDQVKVILSAMSMDTTVTSA